MGLEILSKVDRSAKAKKRAEQVRSDHQPETNIAAIILALEAKTAKQEKREGLEVALRDYAAWHEAQRPDALRGEPLDLGFGFLVSGGALRVVKQHYGYGAGRSGPNIPNHMLCPSCGNPYFNGARCTLCGTMDDD
ncbi:hypothetical protein [Aestuariicoccus sp. MJ-SS9]|uniref:hypothetical protein n=1 Tax=Aestuariicoccus sp. MJ-SS9 TaxID=3079855 RepID=UPI00290CBABC|nr:hypothetical protein [Aestuariicoccus sp. MJ-SS9]MDU8910025.1 hypothetical protein [Aestuariicoccus sp. MJ-SS9]